MEPKAVILAAGKGSRMVDLTCQLPKCLLPVGGLPLLWYPLRLVQDAGIQSALVVVSEAVLRDHKNDIAQIPAKHGLLINVELCAVPGREDPGTADSLRHLRSADHLRATQPLLVLSCDLVTGCALRELLSAHLLRGAALTALFAAPGDPTVSPAAVTAPGPKSRHKPERDLVGLAGPEQRLCLLASEADFEEEVELRLAVLRRHPKLLVRRDLLDAHLYLLAPGLLDFVDKSPQLSSLKGEVVPQVIRAQYRRPRVQPPDDTAPAPAPAPAAVHSANTYLRQPRFAALTARFAAPVEAEDVGRTSCFAVTTHALTWRVNTTAAYLAANRAVTRLWETLPGERPPRLHPQANIPSGKVQLSDDSVVGEGSSLSERTHIQRSVVGRHCSLGPRVRLVDCVLMDHVTVHEDCVLSNCILMNSSTVEAGAQLSDCLVGVNQVVEAGVKKNREVVSQQSGHMEVY
ncbi:Translation initiation factor eIF-2B subunit gamma [Amphibalanus amphitrite]|uniref:Translation initiation factor eIF2B subunit gamma n=1 Tax=Amphibalanus amphitrite TaxID=1232801 RepID=A0A6A4WN67_AMPAM|nr:Translation initiation factor eIF-2B subunit gamma [Amphibalanus amphitrite]